MKRQLNTWQFLLRLICVSALVLAGFGHRSLSLPGGGGPDLAAYILPDGTLPTLCLDGGEHPTDDNDQREICDACRLSSATALTSPCLTWLGAPVGKTVEQPFAATLFIRHTAFPPDAPPRAPPRHPAESHA